mmetsp:Transcript_68944/g.150708  ORF Transcript_68944/g.150708 Transcript_68944/m.150708 type:complete len:230 (+) Transcript_68944:1069-1758(+)
MRSAKFSSFRAQLCPCNLFTKAARPVPVRPIPPRFRERKFFMALRAGASANKPPSCKPFWERSKLTKDTAFCRASTREGPTSSASASVSFSFSFSFSFFWLLFLFWSLWWRRWQSASVKPTCFRVNFSKPFMFIAVNMSPSTGPTKLLLKDSAVNCEAAAPKATRPTFSVCEILQDSKDKLCKAVTLSVIADASTFKLESLQRSLPSSDNLSRLFGSSGRKLKASTDGV